jgi:hypothetical protein
MFCLGRRGRASRQAWSPRAAVRPIASPAGHSSWSLAFLRAHPERGTMRAGVWRRTQTHSATASIIPAEADNSSSALELALNGRQPAGPETPWRAGRQGVISGRGAGGGQLRTAERVAKWRTRPPHATQAIAGHGVTTEKRVRHPCREVANLPRTGRPPRLPAPPAVLAAGTGWRQQAGRLPAAGIATEWSRGEPAGSSRAARRRASAVRPQHDLRGVDGPGHALVRGDLEVPRHGLDAGQSAEAIGSTRTSPGGPFRRPVVKFPQIRRGRGPGV